MTFFTSLSHFQWNAKQRRLLYVKDRVIIDHFNSVNNMDNIHVSGHYHNIDFIYTGQYIYDMEMKMYYWLFAADPDKTIPDKRDITLCLVDVPKEKT